MNNTIFLDIKEFDKKLGPFCMSYGFNLEAIISSIKTVGLVNKPYIRRNKGGLVDIVTGYRRILALEALGWEKVPCIELNDPKLSDADLLMLNLYDNICIRKFNDVEKSMILNRLLVSFSIDDIYKQYMSLLNIPNRREVDILLKIEGLNDHIKEIIAAEILSMRTIESILEMEESSRDVIVKWISNLKLNINQQSLFIEYINDISCKEGKGVQELLSEEIFIGLITEDGQNTPQKAKRFIDQLRARRFPILTKNEKTFARQISDLDLPKGVRIKHSPFFEGPDYLLEISFKDGERLIKVIEELGRLNGLSKIKDPWKEKE
jgi:ParB-like chromosome segregation protein Spo0J